MGILIVRTVLGLMAFGGFLMAVAVFYLARKYPQRQLGTAPSIVGDAGAIAALGGGAVGGGSCDGGGSTC